MAILLFALSIGAYLLSLGLGQEGRKTEALAVFLASVILFSTAAIVAAIGGVAKELAKRFPRTGPEEMMAAYWRHDEEEKASGKKR